MISRRLALFRIASASAVATVAAAPVALAAVQPANPEKPILVRLGRRLAKVGAICRQRAEARAAARSAFEAGCPKLPKELVVTRFSRDLADSEGESDIDGKNIWPSDPNLPQRRYHTADYLRQALADWADIPDAEPEEKEIAAFLTVRLAIAERYEHAVEAARCSSGYREALSAHYHAANVLEDIARRWARCGLEHAEHKAAITIGPGLAADICRVLSGDGEAE